MLTVLSSLPSPITLRPSSAFCQVLAALLQFDGRENATLTCRELCEPGGMSTQYVRNALPRLKRAGIVTGQLGGAGGIRLARPLRKISVLDVLQAVDGPVGLDESDLPAGLSAGSSRALHLVLDGVAEDIAKRLNSLKLSAFSRC